MEDRKGNGNAGPVPLSVGAPSETHEPETRPLNDSKTTANASN